ncbi:hypothetical protein ACFQZ1_10685 [Bacillus sp. CGMCC 1.60114]|uniref:hypothetical protein n=1 Tax=unclassified Bacillus (in: firmicutes) TaxID=185979 RepID=UPI003638DC4F
MNQLQKQILFFLEESNRERSVNQIANRLNKNPEAVKIELGILANNNFIDIRRSTSGKISKATIKPEGKQHFREATTIVTKESVQKQINELKEKLSSLETSFQQAQENPTEENKQTLLEKVDTVQSVANGLTTLVKAGMEFFK